jgi:hypothetical protein
MNRTYKIGLAAVGIILIYLIVGGNLYYHNRASEKEIILRREYVSHDNGYKYEAQFYRRDAVGLMKRKWFDNKCRSSALFSSLDMIFVPYQWCLLLVTGLNGHKFGVHYTFPENNLD